MNQQALRYAVRALKGGGVIAYPTEAVYGLGCDPRNTAALRQLLHLKQRRADKGLILIAANMAQLRPYIALLSADLRARLLAMWPGAYTWVLPARLGVSPLLRGRHRGIAVRITAHPQAAALCRAFGGAIVSTSANRSGCLPLLSAQAVRRQWRQDLAYILAGKTGDRSVPSEIWDSFSGRRLR